MSNRRYSPEFKDEAVRQIIVRAYSVAETAEQLGATAVQDVAGPPQRVLCQRHVSLVT